jgi:hypothetical protein
MPFSSIRFSLNDDVPPLFFSLKEEEDEDPTEGEPNKFL